MTAFIWKNLSKQCLNKETPVISAQAFCLDDGDVFHIHPDPCVFPSHGRKLEFCWVSSQKDTMKELLSKKEGFLVLVENHFSRIKVDSSNSDDNQDNDNETFTVKAYWKNKENFKEFPVNYFTHRDDTFIDPVRRSISEKINKKCVAVVGLGSFGGTIVLELARAGVGRFILIDPDRLEVGNLARHCCDGRDIGRLKSTALQESIKSQNSEAHVVSTSLDCIANFDETKELLHRENCNLIVIATDSILSRQKMNHIALDLNIPTILGRCFSRAAHGDIFRMKKRGRPCFNCVYLADGDMGESERDFDQLVQNQQHGNSEKKEENGSDHSVDLDDKSLKMKELIERVKMLEEKLSEIEKAEKQAAEARAKFVKQVENAADWNEYSDQKLIVVAFPGLSNDILPFPSFMAKLALLDLIYEDLSPEEAKQSGLEYFHRDIQDNNFFIFYNRREGDLADYMIPFYHSISWLCSDRGSSSDWFRYQLSVKGENFDQEYSPSDELLNINRWYAGQTRVGCTICDPNCKPELQTVFDTNVFMINFAGLRGNEADLASAVQIGTGHIPPPQSFEEAFSNENAVSSQKKTSSARVVFKD